MYRSFNIKINKCFRNKHIKMDFITQKKFRKIKVLSIKIGRRTGIKYWYGEALQKKKRI